jgi:quinol monooxygenase YgiN
MQELNQIVVLYAKPGREVALRANLAALVAPSRIESGNLRYEAYIDAGDARRFIFIERWASAEAQQDHHNSSDHVRFFFTKTGMRMWNDAKSFTCWNL